MCAYNLWAFIMAQYRQFHWQRATLWILLLQSFTALLLRNLRPPPPLFFDFSLLSSLNINSLWQYEIHYILREDVQVYYPNNIPFKDIIALRSSMFWSNVLQWEHLLLTIICWSQPCPLYCIILYCNGNPLSAVLNHVQLYVCNEQCGQCQGLISPFTIHG